MGKHGLQKTLPSILLAFVMLFTMLLQGCLREQPEDIEPAETGDPPVFSDTADTFYITPNQRGIFTLRYNPDSTVNPITGMNSDNILLSSLIYESLFSLDSSLIAEPVLCKSWTVEENTMFAFELKPDIAFSDGSFLTASDVVYTYNQAMQRGRFTNRLSNIDKVSVDEEDDLTVIFKLKSPNRRFTSLLDIPVIKSGSIDERVPPGTGPYIFSGNDVMRLERFKDHRDYERLPVYAVFLMVCSDDEAAELFEDGKLSLLWDDPSDTYDIRLNRVHEKRYYDTTALQFIGFNTRSPVLQDADVRRAIGTTIDREFIVNEIMQGSAVVAYYALSPVYEYYNDQWQWISTHIDPQRGISALFDRAGLEDNDNDSYLEYPVGNGSFAKFSLDFIVNSENQYKVRAAHLIASALRRTGISVSVRELPWDNFIAALEAGSFDLYYGEVVLSADFDLSALLLPGGKLNYGRTGSSEYRSLLDDFHCAETAAQEQAAASALCESVMYFSPFSPVLYKKYAVYSPMGAIAGASPSQSGVFRMIQDWTIDLTMIR